MVKRKPCWMRSALSWLPMSNPVDHRYSWHAGLLVCCIVALAAVVLIEIMLHDMGLLRSAPVVVVEKSKKVFLTVPILDTKGWTQMPFLDRHLIASRHKGSIEVREFPTLYCVEYFESGETQDCGIQEQQWYRAPMYNKSTARHKSRRR